MDNFIELTDLEGNKLYVDYYRIIVMKRFEPAKLAAGLINPNEKDPVTYLVLDNPGTSTYAVKETVEEINKKAKDLEEKQRAEYMARSAMITE